MIFVIETIDAVEGPHDTVRPERTMSGPYPPGRGAALSREQRATFSQRRRRANQEVAPIQPQPSH